jgi:hypothetical protein
VIDRYLPPPEVCNLLPGMTTGQLAQMRYLGTGPRYRKPTGKLVLYTEADVVAWVESTARYGTAAEAI